jgi:hypothetical protein
MISCSDSDILVLLTFDLFRNITEVSPPVPVMDLFRLVDFTLVRWDLVPIIFPTWVGMVFVVSFASCLDVVSVVLLTCSFRLSQPRL